MRSRTSLALWGGEADASGTRLTSEASSCDAFLTWRQLGVAKWVKTCQTLGRKVFSFSSCFFVGLVSCFQCEVPWCNESTWGFWGFSCWVGKLHVSLFLTLTAPTLVWSKTRNCNRQLTVAAANYATCDCDSWSLSLVYLLFCLQLSPPSPQKNTLGTSTDIISTVQRTKEHPFVTPPAPLKKNKTTTMVEVPKIPPRSEMATIREVLTFRLSVRGSGPSEGFFWRLVDWLESKPFAKRGYFFEVCAVSLVPGALKNSVLYVGEAKTPHSGKVFLEVFGLRKATTSIQPQLPHQTSNVLIRFFCLCFHLLDLLCKMPFRSF